MQNTESNPMYENRHRYAGILLHITSLPGPYGIGDLGSVARSFVDFLSDAGVSLWQILPLGPTGYGNSPYAARSSFAGNELLISPDILVSNGLLEKAEIEQLRDKMAQIKTDSGVNRVDYRLVETQKLPLLKKAARRFAETLNSDFDVFCSHEAHWLEDYALFQVLCESYRDARWHTVWDKAISKREKDALDKVRAEMATEILEWKDKEKTLTGGENAEVEVERSDGTNFTGIGFSADIRSRTWSFTGEVKGTYVEEDEED